MSAAVTVILAFFAAAGAAVLAVELVRWCLLGRSEFTAVCFDEKILNGESKPDMIYIVRTDRECDEIIKRICESEERRIFIKRG